MAKPPASNGPGDGETAVQVGVRLPHEMVVDVLTRRVGDDVDDEGNDEDGDPDPGRLKVVQPRPDAVRDRSWSGRGNGAGRCYTAGHSSLVQEAGWTRQRLGRVRPHRGARRRDARTGRPRPSPPSPSCSWSGWRCDSSSHTSCFPGSGFQSDIGSFTSWALTLAHGGPGGFYANAGFADYPPGYLYVLWLIGSIGSGLAGLLGGGTIVLGGVVLPLPDTIVGGLIKLPAIAADLGIAYLLYRLVRRWLGPRSDARGAALGAAALYLFNPVTWYDSALWGQIDAVGALVMLVAIAFLIDGFSEAAVGFAVLAALVKPQFGIVLAPLIGVTLLRRHLFLIGSGPRATAVPRALRGWVADEQGVWRLVSCAAVGAVVLFVLITPFGLDVPTLISRMGDTAAGYPYLSVNAYDPWALVGSGGQASLAAGGGWSSDQVPLLAGLNGFTIGALLLGLGFAVGAIQLAWRDSRRSILLTAVFLSLAFFILPTRVHERYLFPVFVFLPLLAVNSRRFRVLTLVLAVGSFINLHGDPHGRQLRHRQRHRPALRGGHAELRRGAPERRPADRRVPGRGLVAAARERPRRRAAAAPDRPRRASARGRPVRPAASRPTATRSRTPGIGGPGGRARVGLGPATGSPGPLTAARPQRRAAARAIRPARPPGRARGPDPDRGRHGPADVGPWPALRHDLRRGLPRPHGHRVPAGLALRRAARHLRVHPSAPGQVPHRRRPGCFWRRQRDGHGRPWRAGHRRRDRDALEPAGPAGPAGRRPALHGHAERRAWPTTWPLGRSSRPSRSGRDGRPCTWRSTRELTCCTWRTTPAACGPSRRPTSTRCAPPRPPPRPSPPASARSAGRSPS